MGVSFCLCYYIESMTVDKQKLKFILDAMKVVSVFTPSGQKLKWLGIIGDEILSHTTNSFLSDKSTAKWVEYVNSVELPKEVEIKEAPTLEQVVEIAKTKRKRGK